MPDSKKRKLSKQLIINLFENNSPGLHYPGQWRNPRDRSPSYKSLDYWIHLAKLAERGKINAIFIADSLVYFDTFNGPGNFKEPLRAGIQSPKNDPSIAISAMAAVTKSLGFAVTFSTISEHPYHLARRLATLDHLTEGRVGWNVVSSFLPSVGAQLLNGAPLPDHDERYIKTDEYLHAVYELLLSSWRDDAVVLDRINNVFVDGDRVREINFKGKYYNIRGPSLSEPSKQRLPVIVQAGTSEKGKRFAAKHAEAVYINGLSAENLGSKIRSFRDLVEKAGRNRYDDIKFLTSATVITAPTDEEAAKKFEEIKHFADSRAGEVLVSSWTGIDLGQYDDDQELKYVENNGMRAFIENITKYNPGTKFTKKTISEKCAVGGTGSAIFVGSPETVAQQIIEFVEVSDVDGFNFGYAVWPETFDDLVDQVIPILQEKGLAQKNYAVEGGTYRENFYGVEGQTFVPENHPAYPYRWQAGIDQEEFERNLKKAKASEVAL